jgi:HK97 family phage prohead protease
MERRIVLGAEVRADPATETSPRRLSGYAAVFNRAADILGRFQERIAPGAFRDSLGSADQVALWNHDSSYPLGRKSAGTLRLQEDETGLMFSLDLPDTQMGRDAHTLVTRGDVRGMSFGFTVPENGDEWAMVDGKRTRTLVRVNLEEISPVTFPAFPSTSVEARSLERLAEEAERRILITVPVDIRAKQTHLRSLTI